MGPDLRQMRYVVAVARERNFTRAAERLHVAQQALSQQVSAVERMLGVPLFDRAARPVRLTPAGAVFVQEAQRALSASERVIERTHAAARGELGKIRLAYTFAVAYETLPLLLDAFTQDTPHVKVASREMFGADMLFYLREDKLDIALTPRVDIEEDLAREAVRREPLTVALPERHRLASQPSVDLAALRDELFQTWPAGVSPGFHAAIVAACHAAGFEPKVDDTATGSTAWRNIAAGKGVALAVASATPQIPRGIALVKLRSPEAYIIIDAVWRRDSDLPAVRRFLESARRVGAERHWLGP
jgi:DNA-binding transcriptional LysR family regulator